MAQGDFTKAEAKESAKALNEIMKAMPKKRAMEYAGHFNDVFLFLRQCEMKCPD